MKPNSIIFTIGIGVLTLFNCTSVSEEDLIEQTVLPDDTVTYVDHVKSIIDNNCISCHSNPPENGAPMALITYENVRDAVENRGLIDRISSDNLGFLMPFGGPRLPQNLIDTVILWEAEGLQEE
ncbi:hypothetical protein C1T31_00545 [Hanstruepera neustonica]|uniref:Cytochrome c domain-containing protein n=1 Tax=Hanstruepera neustonica TaxID=1445657 RepID=A0A2K1E2Z9_9FLAO|nr:hypothetical protein [Hanstruepera neustonica]PNQ74668.1 hypothetical protein C1T31_00545 [Hanstruepera neustonica]